MNRNITRLGLTAFAIVASTAAFSQTVTSGAIAGTIRDGKGNAIAGASVTLVSGQVNRTITTAADGTFRLGLLNPGEYKITVAKEGFNAFKNTVTVTVNQVQTVNAKLLPPAEAVVVVSAAVAQMDLTSNQVGANLSLGDLDAVPKGRDINGLAFLSPGVVTSGQLGGVSISGASSLENSFYVDGLSTQDYRKGFQGSSMPTDFVDQVEVQTGGFKPEFSALGGVFNVVTKSGTNAFSGSAWLNVDADKLQAVAKRNEFYRQAAPSSRYDVGFSAGGAIIKDKLFYFAGANYISTEAPKSDPNVIGLLNGKNKAEDKQVYTKVNWYVATDHQLTFTGQYNKVDTSNPQAFSFVGDRQIGFTQEDKTLNLGLNWDWTISPALMLSVKAGRTSYETTFDPTDTANSRVTNNLWYFDHVDSGDGTLNARLGSPSFERGGVGLYEKLNKSTTTQFRADLSWFLGSHNLKFGVSHVAADYTLFDTMSGPLRQPVLSDGSIDPVARPYRVTVRRSGVTGNFNGLDLTYNSNDSTVKSTFMALYAQDSWEMFSGFRLAFGFRYESQEIKDNAGRSALKFDDFADQIQPRLGITWDVKNDGKTKASANYGRYYLAVPMQPVMRTGGTEFFLRNRYSAARSTYNATTGAWAITNPTPSSVTDFSVFFSAPPLVDGTKLTQRDEYMVGLDQTLENGWTVGIHGKHRELKNPIEDSVIDLHEGYSVLWNPRPGQVTWTGGALSATPGQKITVAESGYPTAFNVYQSVDVTAEKRTSEYNLNLSYTWSRLYGNYEGVGQASNGQADALITSTFDYYPYVGYGLLPIDRTHVIKGYGSHNFQVFGNTFTVGMRLTWQSGTPKSLLDDGSTSNGYAPGWDTEHVVTLPDGSSAVVNSQGAYDNGANYDVDGNWIGDPNLLHTYLDIGGYGNAVPAHGKYGSYGRTPNTLQSDLTLEYAMTFGRVKVVPNITIFNVMNKRAATQTNIFATDGAGSRDVRYGSEQVWQTGRQIRWGVKVNF